jgi:hypothetical protein
MVNFAAKTGEKCSQFGVVTGIGAWAHAVSSWDTGDSHPSRGIKLATELYLLPKVRKL